jgi:hypothetical protein
MPSSEILRESTVVASRCAKVVAGAGSVRSSAGTYTACTEVIEPFVGRGDALLEGAHLGGQRRLVADGARDSAEERGHLGAGLREPEDVVDEQEHVLAFFVAEVLGHREGRQRDAGAGARRLVHLAVHERGLRLRRVAGKMTAFAAFLHLVPEVVALAGALADAGEHGVAAVALGDVVDELHDEDGLADAGAAEQADLAAAGVRGEQVDDLDARLEHLGRGRLLRERPVARGGSA